MRRLQDTPPLALDLTHKFFGVRHFLRGVFANTVKARLVEQAAEWVRLHATGVRHQIYGTPRRMSFGARHPRSKDNMDWVNEAVYFARVILWVNSDFQSGNAFVLVREPQAKGRVEPHHGRDQDRRVKALRFAGILMMRTDFLPRRIFQS